MEEEVSVTKEEVSLERADDILQLALIEHQLDQLLIGPIISLLDGITKMQLIRVYFHIILYLFREGTHNFQVASLEDVDILTSH